MGEIAEPERHAVERRPEPMPPVRAVTWQGLKRAAEERHSAESRMANGAQITERAQYGLERIRARLEATGRPPDELDAMLISSFAFGAAELIQDYMRGR